MRSSPRCAHDGDGIEHRRSPNRLSAMRFVVAFGVVSLLADFVYEGARSIVGPFLATFGESAGLVGFITGAGEAVALVSRLWTGKLSDRTGRHWGLSILGYVITVVSVPLLATTWALWPAAVLVVAERFGKAVRRPPATPCSRRPAATSAADGPSPFTRRSTRPVRSSGRSSLWPLR